MKKLYTYNSKNFPHIDREEYEVTDLSAIFYLGYTRRCFLGKSVEIWDSASGGSKFSLGTDYVLSQDSFDIANSKLVGESCYSGIKFIKQTGKIYVSYDIIASYASADLINDHEARLNGMDSTVGNHGTRLDSIEAKDTNQDASISEINNTLSNHTARILALEQFKVDPYSVATLEEMYAISDCTTGDICYVSATALFYSFTGEEWVVMSGSGTGGGETPDAIETNIDSDYTLAALTQNTKLYFAPSQDRAIDITAGGASVGISLMIHHSGSTNHKLTITYAPGKTIVLTRKMMLIVETVPDGWLFVRESRIGQMNHGYIIPRGAVALAGQLRYKDALWHYISEYYASFIVTEANWQAGDCLKFVNYSETQYRIPDWRGIFSRNSGANSVLKTSNNAAFSGGSVAAVKLDSLQGLRMERNTGGASEITARSAISTGLLATVNGYTTYNVSTTGDPVTDGTNGTPRTGNQTQPVSGSKIAYIFAED